jgi:hypothetical protein
MSATVSTLAYLAASVLFILALRGLSHPETSRQGNLYGMVGMAIAIVATLLRPGMDAGGIVLILVALAIGGAVGAFIATRILMTALPQLVAAFHSLVGMAAVFVAAIRPAGGVIARGLSGGASCVPRLSRRGVSACRTRGPRRPLGGAALGAGRCRAPAPSAPARRRPR